MKIKSFLLLIILATGISEISSGQNVGNYLRRKANMAGNHAANRADQNVNNKINGEVDKKVDSAFNKLWGDDNKNDNEKQEQQGDASQQPSSPSEDVSNAGNQAASNAMMKRMGISTNVKVNDAYNYTGNIVMDVQNWDANGDTEGKILYTTYVNKDNSGFAMDFSPA